MKLLRQLFGVGRKKARRHTSISLIGRSLANEMLEERLAFSVVNLSANEQLLVELINRARANPQAEVGRAGLTDLNQNLTPGTISSTAKQPLAPHQALVNAAGLHSQDMLDRDYFAHINLQGLTPSDRAQAAGYPVGVGENIAWSGSTGSVNQTNLVYELHTNLFVSPGHRTNIMSDSYRELGTGVRYGVYTSGGTGFNAGMVTEMFGNRGGNAFITGVAYTDAVVNDDFYTVGEGVANVTITATSSSTGAVFTESTGTSGGYAMRVPDGTYTLVATGGSIDGQVLLGGVVVSGRNVKVDVVTTEGTQPPVAAGPANGMGIIGRSNGIWWQAESNGTSLVTNAWGAWSPSISWSDVRVGDLDGDGRDDVVGRITTNGQWWVARSNGTQFVNEFWTTWSTAVNWNDVQMGDFNGDGREDLIGRASDGTWWVARSTGTTFVNEFWGAWNPAANWSNVLVGDFNGDGRDDIVGRANGQAWWVGRSTGTGFTSERWGAWSSAVTWTDVRTGDFNGDNRTDIIGRTGKTWWVAEANNTGTAFANKLYAGWSDQVVWSDITVGDFDGNGTDDLTGRTGGQWWVSRSVSGQTLTELWGSWNASVNWSDVRLLDVNRDGRKDLVGRNGNEWWVARATGTQFASSVWGTWPSGQTWSDVLVGDFG